MCLDKTLYTVVLYSNWVFPDSPAAKFYILNMFSYLTF